MPTRCRDPTRACRARHRPARRAPRRPISSEGESYGEMQPPRRHGLSVGNVQPDRSDRRAHAGARAVADLRLEEGIVVPGVAGVDEYADAPVFADPLGVLRAAHQEASPRQDGIALLYAEAQVVVAAHPRVAARAGQGTSRDGVAGTGAGARRPAPPGRAAGGRRLSSPGRTMSRWRSRARTDAWPPRPGRRRARTWRGSPGAAR